MTLDALLNSLRASGEPTRLRILALLAQGELSVSELTRILGQSQPRVSRHLKLLCDAGLITRQPEGTSVFYRLVVDGAAGALGCAITRLMPCDDSVLFLDKTRLTETREERARLAAEYFTRNARQWDEIRSLHVAEASVEAAMREMLGTQPITHALDLGTGTGRILLLLADLAETATGADCNREMLAIARSNLEKAGLGSFHVRQADVQNLPMPDKSVDLVTIHQVLHYLDNPMAALRETARVLQSGGRVLIVDFAPHTIEQLRVEHAHRRLGFSQQEVATWCHVAGFEILQARHLPPAKSDGLTVSLWLARRKECAPGTREKAL